MVALSSFSSSSASSSASTAIDHSSSAPDAPSLDDILSDPQRHFSRFLFDSEPLAVLELLSALLFRSSERGHSAAIECLWCWQDLGECSHSLSPLLEELRSTNCVTVASAAVRLLARLLQFAPDMVIRTRLRNEMDELRFDEIVLSLRERFGEQELEEPIAEWTRVRRAEHNNGNNEDDQRAARALDTDSGTFSAEEEEQKDKVQEQEKNMADAKDKENDNDAAELLLFARSLLPNELSLLLELVRAIGQSPSRSSKLCGAVRSLLSGPASDRQIPSLPPPPPPPISSPPIPPPPPCIFNKPSSGRQIDTVTSVGPVVSAEIPRALRPKVLPDEGRRLRHLQWAKVPTSVVAGSSGDNVWQAMEAVDNEMRDKLNFAALDAFFGCPSSPPRHSPAMNADTSQLRRRSSLMPPSVDSVSLLSSRRSLSINVFLKMCRGSGQLLADMAAGEVHHIGSDRLHTLAQLLPSEEEQQALLQFDGDPNELGAAEQFLLALIRSVPEYRLRIEAMIFRLDVCGMGTSEYGLGLDVWLRGCKELRESATLRKVLYALLHLGNYLNHGAGAGNAVGFRLSSLWKVEDVKAVGQRGGRTLLHFVAQQVDNCATQLLAELGAVREAAKSSFESTRDDVRVLADRMRRLEATVRQKNVLSAGDPFFVDFLHFLEKSHSLIECAERQLAELDTHHRQLASFFCEPERSFSLEECFKVVSSFVGRFERAVKENRDWDDRKTNEAFNNRNAPDEMAAQLRSIRPPPLGKCPRRSLEIVEEENSRNRESVAATPPAGRRRTAHLITPLREARHSLLLDQLGEQKLVDERRMKKSGADEEQTSLGALVDLALKKEMPGEDGWQGEAISTSTLHRQLRVLSISQDAKAHLSQQECVANKGENITNDNATLKPREETNLRSIPETILSKTMVKKLEPKKPGVPLQKQKGSPRKSSSMSNANLRLRSFTTIAALNVEGKAASSKAVIPNAETPLKPSQVKARQTLENSRTTMMARGTSTTTAKIGKTSMVEHCVQRARSFGATPTAAKSVPMMSLISARNGIAANGTPKQQQNTNRTSRLKPTLIRQVSTASRPTLVHSNGSVGSGSAEKRPKWI